MRTKVKLTKQQIKEDKFTNYMLLSRDWLIANWQVTAIGAVVVILAIVGSIYFIKMQSNKKLTGADRLTKAVSEARRQNYQVAILELKNLSQEFSGEIGGMALFNLANTQYSSRNYDEAINDYKKFIDDFHLNDMTTASAYAGIAQSLECKQEFLAAGDKFSEAAKKFPDSPSTPDCYLGAIRNYLQGKDNQKADQLTKELEEKYPGTDYARMAARLIIEMKTN
jgi:TolA-binding protein